MTQHWTIQTDIPAELKVGPATPSYCWECGTMPTDPKERADVERGFKCWRCLGKETRELNRRSQTATEEPK